MVKGARRILTELQIQIFSEAWCPDGDCHDLTKSPTAVHDRSLEERAIQVELIAERCRPGDDKKALPNVIVDFGIQVFSCPRYPRSLQDLAYRGDFRSHKG